MQDLLVQMQFLFKFTSLTFPCKLSIVICGSGASFLSHSAFISSSSFSLSLSRPFSHSRFAYYSQYLFLFYSGRVLLYIVLSSIYFLFFFLSFFIGYMLDKILIDTRELFLVFVQFCLTICLINVKLPKVIMEAYQLDTKLSLVYSSACHCRVYGVYLSVYVCLCVYRSVGVCVYSFNGAVPVSYNTCVRGRHVVALVLFSLYFFHFRFSHSHAFALVLTPSRNIHTLYYSLQNINYFPLFI